MTSSSSAAPEMRRKPLYQVRGEEICDETLRLRAAVAEQQTQNHRLSERNAALDAEVINLKQGRDAAEERARTDLGMIGPQETFYQVVPVVDAAR